MSKKQEYYLEQSKGCPNYHPCPICFACQNRAPHLYEACQTCKVGLDGHDHRAKSWMIRRENFAVTISDETKEQFEALEDGICPIHGAFGKEADHEA